VGTGYRPFQRPVVVVMPLLGQVGVVERKVVRRHRLAHLGRGRDIDILGRHDGAAEQLHLVYGLRIRDTGQVGDGSLRTGDGYVLVDFDVVPPMQAEPATAFGEPATVGIHPSYFGSTELSRYLVEPRVARIHFAAGKGAHLERR